MKFCDSCGNVMKVKSDGTGRFLFCKACNIKEKLEEEISLSQNLKEEKKIQVMEKNESEFPTTKILCPNCDKEVEAFWTMQQTRAADEPPTRFYRCKECNHTWREYG